MSKTICFLCKSESSCCESYDINNTFTSFTHTSISKYIEKTFRQRIVCIGLICFECYNLFNELDLAEKKIVDINEKLRKYLNCVEVTTNNVYCQTDSDTYFDNLWKIDDVKVVTSETSSKLQNKISKPYECHVCLKQFTSKNGMTLHVKRMHLDISKVETTEEESGTQDIKCETKEKNLLEANYINSNFDEDPIAIEENINGDQYISSNNYSDEEKYTHLKEPSSVQKVRGRKKKFPGILKPHQCTLCTKSWKSLTELKNHMVSHNDARPFICEVCGQAYKHKTALNVHVGMHKGINPFTCMYCNKSFTQKGALQRHLPLHTGETPYQCDLCGKRFVHHTSFNIHKLSHSGEKLYKCEVCDLALLSGSHLKRHLRVHTGERKYACPICNKRFAERYNLMSHQKLHDFQNNTNKEVKKRNHRCQICGKSYERKIKLDEHMVDCLNCPSDGIVNVSSINRNQDWISSN